ncbi:MAG: ATP-binding protein [Alphaproteobacteria bacterium]|nr:ATP-binding protein [Alphaproteobacteria bacterium]
MRRFWPGGVASRVALILLFGLFALQAISMLFYVRDRADATFRVFAESVADRIVAVTELMEATPAAGRPQLIRSITSPTLFVQTLEQRPKPLGAPVRVEREVRRYLEALGDRPLQVDFRWRRHRHWHDDEDDDGREDREDREDRERELGDEADPWPAPDLLPSREKIAITVGMLNGGWIRFVVSSEETSLVWATRMGFWVTLTAIIIAVFAWWAARRVTKPLTVFAAAADRLGVDVNAPPLPEAGSRELRQATRAFNRMQDRLKRFVDDRTQMIAAISHDLRTALTRLQLRAEFIDDAEQQKKALADIEDMKTMLEATLSFARDDAARESRAQVDLASMLQSLCSDMVDAGKAATYRGPDRLVFDCRPVGMRRALANLIDNAASYGQEAEVTLEEDATEVRVVVADRGPGIPDDKKDRVFAPFFRLEASRSRDTGGTGLGLAVARTIVRGHGGDIALEDRPGGGLVARVTLPRATG